MAYRRELTTTEIRAGEMSQRLSEIPLLGVAYKAVRSLATGSESAAFKPASWAVARYVDWFEVDEETWREGAGNGEAGLLPRTWNKAIVLGAGQAALHEAFSRVDSKSCDQMQPSAAFHYRGKTHVGVMEGGIEVGFGELAAANQQKLYGVAMREGRRPISATMGFWLPSEQTLFVPKNVQIIDDLVPNNDLPARYPGMPLV